MRIRDERGAATVMATVWIGFMVIVASACLLAAAVLVTHRRAQSAADLAALAGAQAHQKGDDACATASQIAARNRARLVTCEVLDADVSVTVTAEAQGLTSQVGSLRARARAGPVGQGVGLAPADLA